MENRIRCRNCNCTSVERDSSNRKLCLCGHEMENHKSKASMTQSERDAFNMHSPTRLVAVPMQNAVEEDDSPSIFERSPR
jgi:hypothetical protein